MIVETRTVNPLPTGLDRVISRLEDKLDVIAVKVDQKVEQVSNKLDEKIENHTERMESKLEKIEANARISEARRTELYLTRTETLERLDVVNNRLDERIEKEVKPLVFDNMKQIESLNRRLNGLYLLAITTLAAVGLGLLETIFRIIPGVIK